MAQRGKRISRNDNDSASCPGAIKRRKCRVGPSASDTPVSVSTLGPSEEEETMASSSQGGSSWTPRPISDIKISSIYNRSAAEPPAELYRKDLISAMKLPDSEPLSPSEYWVISDQWKQEWEKGVQVPVNPDSLPEPTVTVLQNSPTNKLQGEFKLPKKFLRISRDESFNPEEHYLSTTPARAEKACGYDLDDTDIAWLEVLNGERTLCGQPSITETQLERVIEELEHRCWDKIQTIVKNEEGLGIEFDENVICDVCRSPDSEEGNEMVFCDFCNICVHQACYGITSIPDGSWLCRTCSLGQRPECVLCPNPGGAMKSTRSGQKWAHVSCALWIPEVSIGCVERMEPITKISSIPQSRWALICVLCRERVGACIQCSIKTCKTAYHVTCAFKHGLEMKAIIEDEQAEDGVKLRSYCQKHGKINTKDKTSGGGAGSGSGKGGSDSDEGEVRRRKRKDMSSEEKNQARAAKLQEIEAEFDKHVSLKDIMGQQLDVDIDAIVYIYNYWKLKRRSGHNKPLLPPRCGELTGSGVRAQGQAADNEKMRKFVQLRQDLERVRNLCYMVNRREKLCRTFLRLREQTFHKQVLLVSSTSLPASAVAAVLEANHGPSIYDHLYSHLEADTHTHDIDSLAARIKGLDAPSKTVLSDEKKHQPDFNGASNKKLHFNGSVTRKKLYASDISSMSSSEETDQPKPSKSTHSSKQHLDKKLLTKSKIISKIETDSSTEDEDKTSVATSKASSSKVSPRRKSKKTSAPDRPRMSTRRVQDDSSESDSKPETAATRSRTLHHMERELGSATGSDSDILIPISNKSTAARLGPTSIAEIYSDTDSSLDRGSSNSAHGASKAPVKPFSARKKDKDKYKDKDKDKDKDIKVSKESLIDDIKKEPGTKKKENPKTTNRKRECIASALIVPQRQAAKKASEIMQRSQNKKESSNATSTSTSISESSMDIKPSLIEDIKPTIKQLKESKESRSSSSTSTSRKGKQEHKASIRETKSSKGNDIYDFDKEFGDNSEIFAYVPQRQAAKKAAEHIKSGVSSKSSAPPIESDLSDNKVKKETPEIVSPPSKKRHEIKKEESPIKEEATVTPKKPVKKPLPTAVLSESSSSSSSSSSCSSSSDSSSDTDESKSPERPSRRNSTNKERTISTSTSSESDSGHHSSSRSKTITTSKNRPSPNKSESKIDSKADIKTESKLFEEDDKKSSSLSSSSGTGRKLKKLPDKKLKTSDGRHGHEFQPPSTERDESSRASSASFKDEHKDGKQFKEHQHQQTSGKHKPAEYKESSAKRSTSVQSQKHRHQQQHQSQTEADEGVLSRSRDNDGSRNLLGLKSSKKSSPTTKQLQQQHEQQQQQSRQQSPPDKGKEDISAPSKGKTTETRKRKPSQVPQKEEKSNSKDVPPIKKVEKKLNEKQIQKTTVRDDIEFDDIELSAKEKIKTVEPIQKPSTPTSESPSTRSDSSSKKSKKTNNKNIAVTLEEEMKQRRAERDSPKKSSRGLDKLLEKREHLDKLSRSKNAELLRTEKNQLLEKFNRSESPEVNKATASKTSIREKSEEQRSHEFDAKETVHKKDLADTPLAERLTEDNKKIREQKVDVLPSNTEQNENRKHHPQQYKDDLLNKGTSETLFSKPLPDKLSAINEISEKENSNKRRRSVNRSIFSPQHGSSKDTGVAELFDFDQDILTDDMVNDDGFSIPRDAEERAAPLSFSFNNELWFKEDTKEDSARETMNLVEKLRMELYKKSNSSQFELEPTIAAAAAAVSVEADMKGLRSTDLKHKNQVQQPEQQLRRDDRVPGKAATTEMISHDLKSSNSSVTSHLPENVRQSETQRLEEKQKSCYANSSEAGNYVPYGNEDLEGGKVAMAERAKLDRAEADERWVPPSMENFNAAEQLSAIIDSHAHRYGLSGQQFPSNLSGAVLSAENANSGNLVHPQLHVDMQEQYNMIRAAAAVQQHIEQHSEQQARTVQTIASLVEQQVGSIPTHMVDEMTPMEMVNRHLIGLPNADDDQNDDRTMDKDEIGSEIARQDYGGRGSPYTDITAVHQDTRWAESQVLPSRRSTSSSITSASSVDDHSGIPPYKSNSGSGIPPMNFPACSVEAAVSSYHSYEPANNYSGPVSLFPPQPSSTQLPYPSPGTAMFPPPFGAPFPTPQSLLPHVSKPLDEQITMQASPCTAAFTSSSHNMAFTAAMVSPSKLPSSPPSQSTLDEHQPEDLYQQQLEQQTQQAEPHQQLQLPQPPPPPPSIIEESPAAAVATAFINSVSESLMPEQPIEPVVHEVLPNEQAKSTPTHAGKKSPSKPTRTSARVTSLQAKSPGKSPRQQEATKPGPSGRGRGRGAKSNQGNSRGRGRGRGRGRAKASQHNSTLHSDDSIQHKLVGTVYDFDSDEDSPSETNIADLRTMRERKKSIEFSASTGSERRDSLATVANDSLASHHSSPSEQRHAHKGYIESKRLAISSSPVPGDDSTMGAEFESGACQNFSDPVMPLLPGPVDMRTYNSNVEIQRTALQGQSYSNHLLGPLTAASADHSIPDVEEDLDKELRSDLIAEQQPDLTAKCIPAIEATSTAFSGDPGKVSLMDSRNQLKVKIKGPFLDANYATASAVTIPLAQQVNPIITPTANSVCASGTSNLRRMRKKELLRQYCSQDMNMDDPTSSSITSVPVTMPPISRTVITIPKAVASMTSIPTREDYKAVVDANMEKKRRKERASVTSLGNLFDQQSDTLDDQPVIGSERRRSSSGATGGTERRRGRQPRPSAQTTAGTSSSTSTGAPPKLKIKISGALAGQDTSLHHEDRSNNRPPKKRLCSIPNNMPSIEELKRESMIYRRMIFEDFISSEKPSKIKKDKKDKDKSGKRKKKQSSKAKEEVSGHVQILEGGAAPPKLIIRLGKSSQSSGETESGEYGTLSSSGSTSTATMTTNTATTTSISTNCTMTSGSGSQESCEQARLAPPPSTASEEEPGNRRSNLGGAAPPDDKQLPAQLEHLSASALRNVRCAKVTPIRLKLTRCQEGYELKSPGTGEQQSLQSGEHTKERFGENKRKREEEEVPSSRGDEKLPAKGQSATATTPTSQHNSPGCPPAPLPQGCQVR